MIHANQDVKQKHVTRIVNREDINRWLRALRKGADPTTTPVVWQCFDDSPLKRQELARTLHAPLNDTTFRWIECRQAEGCGIFATVNETKNGGRKKTDFSRAAGVWQDDDEPKPEPTAMPLTPQIVVETSPGKWQQIMTTEGTDDPTEFRLHQQVMVDQWGSDPNAADEVRVLRVAGTWHLKDPDNPFQVRIHQINEIPPYAWNEIKAALPASPKQASAKVAQPERQDGFEVSTAVRNIISGDSYHDSLRDLAAHYAALNMPKADAQATIYELLDQSDDGSDRFKARRADVPRYVDSGYKKFAPTSAASLIEFIDRSKGTMNAVDLISAVASQVADGNVLSLDRAAVVTYLKSAVKGFTKADIVKAFAEAEDEEQDAPTHAKWSRRLLDELKAESNGIEPVAAHGMLYTVGLDNIWRGRDLAALEVEAAKRFDGREMCSRRSDYQAIAQHALAIAGAEKAEFFDNAPVGLASTDDDGVGVFHRLVDGEVVREPLTPDHRQRFLSPAPVDGPMPLYEAFLEQTFASEHPGEAEEQKALLQEICGAAALGFLSKFEKAIKFKGDGRAGKGTQLKIIESLTPVESRVASSPFRWNDQYYLAALAGKRLNLVGELTDAAIPAAEFKGVLGRDLLTGRHPAGRPFEFRCGAGHIFNSNFFVTTKDRSEAFYTRWIILHFPNSRIGMPGDAIDADLAARIIDQELGQIMAWALAGAQRLIKRGRFEMTRAHDRQMGLWRRRSDTLQEFLHDEEVCSLDYGLSGYNVVTEIDRDGGRDHTGQPLKSVVVKGWAVRRSEFYKRYVDWCKAVGRRAMTKSNMTDALNAPAAAALGIRVHRDALAGFLVESVKVLDQGGF